jgi:chromate transporter
LASIISKTAFEFICKGFFSTIISFGGGDAYLTVADGMFVESGMLTEKQFYEGLVQVVNLVPGSILCKTLSGIGYYIGINETRMIVSGIILALVGFICSISASVITFMLCYIFYNSVCKLNMFIGIRRRIRAIVSGLMLTVICSLIYSVKSIGVGFYGYVYVLFMLVDYIICVLCKKIYKCSNICMLIIAIIISLFFCNVCKAGGFYGF